MNQTTSTSSLEYQALPSRQASRGSYRWFAILCVIALLTASLHENVQVHQVSHDANFEYLLLSQETSGGYCAAHGHCVRSKLRPFFTIHGLWPSNSSSWPESCNLTIKFDVGILGPIRAQLDEFWPSMISSKDDSFWSHEWHKHGSCAMSIPKLSGVFNYFNGTLDLQRTYNISRYFSEAGIVPSRTKTYSVDVLLQTLTDDLASKANLVCLKAEGFALPILTEVRFCLSKTTLKPFGCKFKHENCGSGNVFYLPIQAEYSANIRPGWSQLLVRLVSFYVNYLSPV